MVCYEAVIRLLLKILTFRYEPNDNFIQYIVISILNSLACQVDHSEKRLMGDLGAVEVIKVKGGHIVLNGKPISELQSVTCRMGSHSVTCHPTQVNAPSLNPSQIGRYSIYLPQRDGRLS